jgi:hypothetical protein
VADPHSDTDADSHAHTNSERHAHTGIAYSDADAAEHLARSQRGYDGR